MATKNKLVVPGRVRGGGWGPELNCLAIQLVVPCDGGGGLAVVGPVLWPGPALWCPGHNA